MKDSSERPAGRRDRVLAPPSRIRHSSRVVGRDWKRLAGYVRSRRVLLGYASTRQLAHALGISERTIGNLERGVAVGLNTLAVVENHLMWQPGSALAVLGGGEPAVLDESADRPLNVAAAQARILSATSDELVEIRSLIEEVSGPEIADGWLRAALRMRESANNRSASQRDAG